MASLAWTASKTSRAIVCPASTALAHCDEAAGEAADRGTEIHRYLEVYATRGREEAAAVLPTNPVTRARCERVDLAPLLADATSVEVELPVAYDPQTETTTRIPRAGARGYAGVPDGAIAGTVDLVVVGADGAVQAWDYKTGARLVEARENGQLAFFAVSLARLYGVDAIRVGIVQVDDAGDLSIDAVDFDAWTLDTWARKLRKAHASALVALERIERGLVPSTFAGDHCTWCPALRHCPSHHALAREISSLSMPPGGETRPDPWLTPAEAGELWSKLAHYEKILSIVKASLRQMAEAGPLPAPGGKIVVAQTEQREFIRAAPALPVLREHLSPDQLDRVVEFKVSKAAIARELEPSDARVLLEALRAAGAFLSFPYSVVRTKNDPSLTK